VTHFFGIFHPIVIFENRNEKRKPSTTTKFNYSH